MTAIEKLQHTGRTMAEQARQRGLDNHAVKITGQVDVNNDETKKEIRRIIQQELRPLIEKIESLESIK